MLSTITSSKLSQAERVEEVLYHLKLFGVLHEVRKVRDFQLELCANIWGSVGEEPVRILEGAVAEEEAREECCALGRATSIALTSM